MVVHQVITTEKVPFVYRVAGIGSRLLAWLIDCTLILLIGFAGVLMGSVLEEGRGGVGQSLILLWIFALMWGYFLLFEAYWHGQTPGKRLVGIRVIQWSGTAISFTQSAVRNIVRFVDSLPFFYLVGFCVATSNQFHRRLGDLAAGTLVVHVDRKAKPLQAWRDGEVEAEITREAQLRRRLAILDKAQKQTLLDLCLRRDQLLVNERARLFSAISNYLKTRCDLAPAQFQSDERFVLELVAVMEKSAA